jgi:phospholipase C
MRLLPDRTYHCPSCGSEVLPAHVPSAPSKSEENGLAYWSGWADGRFQERDSFVDNPNLAKGEAPSDRLDYYRGHRAGTEARRAAETPEGSSKPTQVRR